MKRHMIGLICLAALLFPLTTFAGKVKATYSVLIERVLLGDSSAAAVPKYVKLFTLPKKVVRGKGLASRAVLHYAASGVNFTTNEMYLNPVTDNCFPTEGDPLAEASLGRIRETDEGAGWWRHLTLPSDRFQKGISCSANVECEQSSVCDKGKCKNRLLICARAENGTLQSGALDDFYNFDGVLDNNTK